MREQAPFRLAGKLREAAEAFFRADLSAIQLRRGDLPQQGCAACAWGNRIWLPARMELTLRGELELLGHELAHIVQQMQGRVPKTLTLGGWTANDDPALEREAVEAGKRFALGDESHLPSHPLSTAHPAVLQRAISVGDRVLTGQNDLSVASGALRLIDGGPAWLAWAIGSANVHYHYRDEASLLVGMQSGLHGSDLMLLRVLGVQLHPFKLLEMEPEDLSILTAAENEAPSNGAAALQGKKTLAKYHLLSRSELNIGAEFLAQTEVADAPVFQGITLGDRIALFNLVDGASSELSLNQMIQKESAAFAIQRAQNAAEFVDYYQFYISCVSETDPAAKGAAARARKAETQLELIAPLLYGKLLCPAAQGVPTPDQINVILQNWVAAGNNLSFARLSQALAQVGQYANLKVASGESASKVIESYMEQARQCILQRPAGTVELTQDGLDRHYSYWNRQTHAEISLAPNGDVTLASCQPNQAKK